MQVTYTSRTHRWHTPIPTFPVGEWLDLDFSWSKDSGLQVFVNNELVVNVTNPLDRVEEATSKETLVMLVGQAFDAEKEMMNGKFLLEELSFFEKTRIELANTGMLKAGMLS